MKPIYKFFTVVACCAAAGGLLLSTCAANETSGVTPDTSSTPSAATQIAMMLEATPPALVLRRSDLPAGATQPELPPGRDERDSLEVTPIYEEAVRALPQVGSPAPDFTLNTLDGVTVTLSSLRGRPVLINFWASWCVPCREEAPALQRLYGAYRDQELIILGVNVTQQDTSEDARHYVSEFKLTFPIPMDEGGVVVRAYRVPGLPTSFFVDPRGVIRDVVMGKMDWAAMQEGLELTKPW